MATLATLARTRTKQSKRRHPSRQARRGRGRGRGNHTRTRLLKSRRQSRSSRRRRRGGAPPDILEDIDLTVKKMSDLNTILNVGDTITLYSKPSKTYQDIVIDDETKKFLGADDNADKDMQVLFHYLEKCNKLTLTYVDTVTTNKENPSTTSTKTTDLTAMSIADINNQLQVNNTIVISYDAPTGSSNNKPAVRFKIDKNTKDFCLKMAATDSGIEVTGVLQLIRHLKNIGVDLNIDKVGGVEKFNNVHIAKITKVPITTQVQVLGTLPSTLKTTI
jgi:hypothetical protein